VSGGNAEDILDEDTMSAFLLGRLPFEQRDYGNKASIYFPEGMAVGPLYPENSSSFMDPKDGELTLAQRPP
jgi:hypothetical protein